MPSFARFKILLLSAALILLSSGCGTRHTIQGNGQTGVALGGGKAAFPGPDGELIVGELKELQPGTLIHIPATAQEIITTLRAAGAKFEEKP